MAWHDRAFHQAQGHARETSSKDDFEQVLVNMKTPAGLFSLKERVAVVIGGTGELCSTMAEGLAVAGATVALVGRDADKARVRLDKISKEGGKAEFFPCDTTSKAGLQKLLADVLAQFKRVDVLVNGAGVNSPTPFLDISEEEFDKIIKVNLKGVMLACQIFGRHMVARGSAASSMSAQRQVSRRCREYSPIRRRRPPCITSQKISRANGPRKVCG